MEVSILTVTYNAELTVGKTLESVVSQSFTDYEHIIMDGASTDRTPEIVEASQNPRKHIYSEPDKGLYDAMNKALARAKGRYVIFLNAGDTFADSDSLLRLIETARKNDFPEIVYGQTDIVNEKGIILGPRHLTAPEKLGWKDFSRGMLVCHQAFMARRDIAPLYNLRYRFSADFDWCVRCLKASQRTAYVGDKPIIHYLNEGLTTRNHRASLKERFAIMCRHYGRVKTIINHIGFAIRHLKHKISSIIYRYA